MWVKHVLYIYVTWIIHVPVVKVPDLFIININCRIRSLQFTSIYMYPPPKKKTKQNKNQQQILKLPHKIWVVQCMINIADFVLINWSIEQSLRTSNYLFCFFFPTASLSFIRSTSTGPGTVGSVVVSQFWHQYFRHFIDGRISNHCLNLL